MRDFVIQRYGQSCWRVNRSKVHFQSKKSSKSMNKIKQMNVTIKDAKKNIIDASRIITWGMQCMQIIIYLIHFVY